MPNSEIIAVLVEDEENTYEALMAALGRFVTAPTFTVFVSNRVTGVAKEEHRQLIERYNEWVKAKLANDAEQRLEERRAMDVDTNQTLGVEQ